MTYTALLIGLSPLLVAWLRTTQWSASVVAATAVSVALLAYVCGRYLDGVQPTLDPSYLAGFAQAVMGQQALYLLLKETPLMQTLVATGSPPPVVPYRFSDSVIQAETERRTSVRKEEL